MTRVKALTESEAFQLMFAEVGGGWINVNLLANLTAKQLRTAHIDYREEEDYVIDVWLNPGEFTTIASGFRNENTAQMVLYYIRPKASRKEYKHLKRDGLTVFEFHSR